MSKKVPMIGKRFERLEVLHEDGHLGTLLAYKCQCDCGEQITVRGPSLRTGNTTSCGCLQKENFAKRTRKHGKRHTTEYSIWSNMMSRCNNPNVTCYERYGGRGITVDAAWHSFEQFYADMGDRPEGFTLERIDNEGPYSKENCRWATIAEQNRNTRRTQTITFNGEIKCMKDWAATYNIPYNTLRKRFLLYGWSFEKALTTPPRKMTKRESPFQYARAR